MTQKDERSDLSKLLIPNSCQVPNAYLDDVFPLLQDGELRVMLYAIRRTFGFRKQRDAISLTQFVTGQKAADGTILDHGTGLNRATVVSALESLRQYSLVNKRGTSSDGDVWEPQLNYAAIDFDGLNERRAAAKQKAKKRLVYPLNQARAKRFNGKTAIGLTDKPAGGLTVKHTKPSETQRNPEEAAPASEVKKTPRKIPSLKHPALSIYVEFFPNSGLTLNDDQKFAIIDTVTDLVLWRKVCKDYKLAPRWDHENIGRVLIYYRNGGKWPEKAKPGSNGIQPPAPPPSGPRVKNYKQNADGSMTPIYEGATHA